MASEAKGKGPLREWAFPSYGVKYGRAASSVGGSAPGAGDASKQMPTGKGGVNGAPGIDSQDRSGSADMGRNKWGGSELPPAKWDGLK
jgi:hypothetical protein